MTRKLPHDDYIAAVTTALENASLGLTEYHTEDCEARTLWCHLSAVITLDPDGVMDMDAEHVPDDAVRPQLLIWEWHVPAAAEDGETPGPSWQFAELFRSHRNEQPTMLPVPGYASPQTVVHAARLVFSGKVKPDPAGGCPRDWDGGVVGVPWERHAELDAACTAWGTDEEASGE